MVEIGGSPPEDPEGQYGQPGCDLSGLLGFWKPLWKHVSWGEGQELILSSVTLKVTLTSLDIPFAMFAPKNLELEDVDPMVSQKFSVTQCLSSWACPCPSTAH